MENIERVSIHDPNATVFHHFPFGVGDEVVLNADGDKATVEDAIWEGHVPGAYNITYKLVTANGDHLDLELNDLLPFNRNEKT